ncbi:hypothetical protein CTA1_11758 [Colletotrichum tanaceti]|uniref:Uncharacterized protein n=1 Tax=Colletotrichum tanaceti TaxID=1306861 RepID=A0A4U6XJV3_9PEZI|nr:hypothetical protein CTA1_11758 [Colletotrichum tanaceti]
MHLPSLSTLAVFAEKDLRREIAPEDEAAIKLPGNDAIYSTMLHSLKDKENRTTEHAASPRESSTQKEAQTWQRPVYFNPYPNGEALEPAPALLKHGVS